MWWVLLTRATQKAVAVCGSEELPLLLNLWKATNCIASHSGWDCCQREGTWPRTSGSENLNLSCMSWKSAVPWQKLYRLLYELVCGVGHGKALKLDQGLYLGVVLKPEEGGQGKSEMIVCTTYCRVCHPVYRACVWHSLCPHLKVFPGVHCCSSSHLNYLSWKHMEPACGLPWPCWWGVSAESTLGTSCITVLPLFSWAMSDCSSVLLDFPTFSRQEKIIARSITVIELNVLKNFTE